MKPLKTNNQPTTELKVLYRQVPPTYRHTESQSTLELFILNLKSRVWKTCKPSQNISYASVLSIIIKCYRGDLTHVLWAISCTFLIPSVMSIFVLTPFPPLSLHCHIPESLPLWHTPMDTHYDQKWEDRKRLQISNCRLNSQFIASVEPTAYSVLKLWNLQACICFLVINK